MPQLSERVDVLDMCIVGTRGSNPVTMIAGTFIMYNLVKDMS